MELYAVLQRLQASPSEIEMQQFRQQLQEYINYLISRDFNGLVQLLYTVDVSEQKLKNALREQPHRDASEGIAELILTRLQEKAESRQQFTDKSKPDEERW